MTRLGILLSGRGSNFLAIHAAIACGELPDCKVAVVLSNRAAAPGLTAAHELGLEAHAIPSAGLSNPPNATISSSPPCAKPTSTSSVSQATCASSRRPSSPPSPTASSTSTPRSSPPSPASKPSARPSKPASTTAGCTVHFVDEQVDHGAIILQRTVPVLPHDTVETLSARILTEEHRAYPEALRLILRKALRT